MLPSHRTGHRRAFNLVELAVVFIVVAVVAAIAIPLFTQVIEESSNRSAEAELAVVLRNAVAIAAFNDRPLGQADLQQAFDEIAAASPGVSAAAGHTVCAEDVEDPQPACDDATVNVWWAREGDVVGVVVKDLPRTLGRVQGVTVTHTWVDPDGTLADALAGPQPPALTAPTDLRAVDNEDHVALTWNPSTGATGYLVLRSTSDIAAASVVASPTSASFNDTSAETGTQYTYWVRATRLSGTSGPSNPAAGRRPPAFAQVTAGYTHTCGVTTSGRAYCWGSNSFGQLGTGTGNRTLPTPVAAVPGLTETNVASISAFGWHTCAVTKPASPGQGGQAFCWGQNTNGQLGDNTTFNRTTPTAVTTDPDALTATNVATISAGVGYTCAVTRAGRAFCWGQNTDGRLGTNTGTANRTTPTAVTTSPTALTATNVASISAGYSHTCAVTTPASPGQGGRAFCWGQNVNGRLGTGTGNQTAPTAVTTSPTALTATNVASISAGFYHTCAVTTAGQAFCWGQNAYGQLGTGTGTADHTAPTPLPAPGTDVASIAAASGHTCAVTTGKRVFCWGWNPYGVLGTGPSSTGSQSTPTEVVPGDGLASGQAASVTTGNNNACALTTSGRAFCWGQNLSGQLGNGTTTSSSTPSPSRVQI